MPKVKRTTRGPSNHNNIVEKDFASTAWPNNIRSPDANVHIADNDLKNYESENGLWKCPVPDCGKELSRKQTLRSHLITRHSLMRDRIRRRYKLYEVDNSIPMPKSTYFLKKKEAALLEAASSPRDQSEALGEGQSQAMTAGSSTCTSSFHSDGNADVCIDSGLINLENFEEGQTQDCFDVLSTSDCSDMDISSDMESECSIPSYHSSESEDSDVECAESSVWKPTKDDPPLYVLENTSQLWSSSITKSAHHLAVSAYSCRHNLSDIAIKELLDLIQLHIPPNNIGDTKVSKLKELCGFDNTSFKYHYYCDKCKKLFSEGVDSCKTPGCIGKQSDPICRKYFLTCNINTQISEVLEREGIWQTILDSKASDVASNSNLSDIKSGLIYKKLREPGGFLHKTENITFSLFTDGVPLFKSSGISIWPVYLLINELSAKERFHRKNMLLWGVWQGSGKPNMNMFLKPLVLDLLELHNKGVCINISDKIVTVKAMLILATMDLPARAGVLNMTQHNGMCGCSYCMEPGETVPSGGGYCRIYPVRDEPPKERTDLNVRKSAQAAQLQGKRIDGFLGESVLLYLPSFSIADNVVIDYMHGILLGITKLFLSLWFDPKYAAEPYSISHHITEVDKLLKNIHPPYMIHRHPRILSKTYHHWKASELRNWLLFYSIPCLVNRLPDVYLSHFSCLIEGTYLLLGEGISPSDLSRAELLFKAFVRNIENLYHRRILGINVHNLTHLVQCVRNFGPLWGYSCFAFESFNGELKRSIHGTGNVSKQLFWVLQAQKRVEQKSKILPMGKTKDFLKSMLGETTRLKGRTEAYQCYVGKLKPVSDTFSDRLKQKLCDRAGSCEVKQFMEASKISRNGFLMYSCSSNRKQKQNSYTIALETKSVEVVTAIEVDMYLLHVESRKVFAVGTLLESSRTALSRRVPHLRVYSKTCDQAVVKSEELREPLVVVKKDDKILYAACLPNQFERD